MHEAARESSHSHSHPATYTAYEVQQHLRPTPQKVPRTPNPPPTDRPTDPLNYRERESSRSTYHTGWLHDTVPGSDLSNPFDDPSPARPRQRACGVAMQLPASMRVWPARPALPTPPSFALCPPAARPHGRLAVPQHGMRCMHACMSACREKRKGPPVRWGCLVEGDFLCAVIAVIAGAWCVQAGEGGRG